MKKERIENQMKKNRVDPTNTTSVYIATPAVSTVFQMGQPIQSMEGTEPQEAESALQNLKKALSGLKQSADEMTEGFAELFQSAKENDGKPADVNEILRQILAEKYDKVDAE